MDNFGAFNYASIPAGAGAFNWVQFLIPAHNQGLEIKDLIDISSTIVNIMFINSEYIDEIVDECSAIVVALDALRKNTSEEWWYSFIDEHKELNDLFDCIMDLEYTLECATKPAIDIKVEAEPVKLLAAA